MAAEIQPGAHRRSESGGNDTDPARTPGLEDGGGVTPGDTPPDSGQTSGLSHRESSAHQRVPRTAWLALIIAAALIILFAAVAIGIFV